MAALRSSRCTPRTVASRGRDAYLTSCPHGRAARPFPASPRPLPGPLIGGNGDGFTAREAEVAFSGGPGDFTWNSVSGRIVGLKPVPLQSLSELERVRLQDVAFRRLLRDGDPGCHVATPKYGHKHKKLLRRKFDSLSKEKSKDKETVPQAFGIPLSQVISNDRTHKQRHDPPREEHGESVPSFLGFNHGFRRSTKELSSSSSSLSSASEAPNESADAAPRTRRVEYRWIASPTSMITSLGSWRPFSSLCRRRRPATGRSDVTRNSASTPFTGLQTVGIFRVGSSKKRARQLREAFDQGSEVHLEEDQSVHDVAALLKEFLRDMPDPLLTRELYTPFINTMLLEDSDQDAAVQLLMFLLPPCNSDTLQRLLCLLSTVAAHADDTFGHDGERITGNKMTSLNLATIFGPNLLHKQKNSDKEFAVQSFARAEESSAVISVVQRMIRTYENLFMVPADIQNEVLMSVQETDPDVVDYLLRRKASRHSEPGLLRAGDPFRCVSNDSIGASSGEVSPYDNNSPVLSDRLLCKYPEDRSLSESFKVGGRSKDGSGSTSPTLSTDKEASTDDFWGTWDELFSKDFNSHHITGSLGDVSECESDGSSEGLSSHQGNDKLPVRQSPTPLGVTEIRPHPPVTRSCSGPFDQRRRRQPTSLPAGLSSQSTVLSSDSLAQKARPPACASIQVGADGASRPRSPGQLGETHISQSTPSLFPHQPDGQSPAPQAGGSADASGPGQQKRPGTPRWQTERWHMWNILSKENADALPETLV
ncbi:rho GTPase-activating protein 6 isoform 3-T3 [Spinachia spinachia]